jgi:uncharacterized membrane protein
MTIKLLAALLLVVVLIPPCAGTVGVGVGTGKIAVDEPLMPGGTYQLSSMTVLNTGDEPGTYTLEVTYLHEQPELRPPGEWVSFTPASFSLEPKQSQSVAITLYLPLDAEPGDYFCFLEAHPVTEGGGFRIGVAAATKLYFSVKPATIIAAMVHKVSSGLKQTAPASYIVIIAVLAIAVIFVLRKHISIEVKRKGKGE